jgi:hypothetical protein
MRKLQIEFSGWIHCDAIDVEFVCIGRDDPINGEQWLDLPEDERSEYVLLSLSDARNNCIDGLDEQIDITETVD